MPAVMCMDSFNAVTTRGAVYRCGDSAETHITGRVKMWAIFILFKIECNESFLAVQISFHKENIFNS